MHDRRYQSAAQRRPTTRKFEVAKPRRADILPVINRARADFGEPPMDDGSPTRLDSMDALRERIAGVRETRAA